MYYLLHLFCIVRATETEYIVLRTRATSAQHLRPEREARAPRPESKSSRRSRHEPAPEIRPPGRLQSRSHVVPLRHTPPRPLLESDGAIRTPAGASHPHGLERRRGTSHSCVSAQKRLLPCGHSGGRDFRRPWQVCPLLGVRAAGGAR